MTIKNFWSFDSSIIWFFFNVICFLGEYFETLKFHWIVSELGYVRLGFIFYLRNNFIERGNSWDFEKLLENIQCINFSQCRNS